MLKSKAHPAIYGGAMLLRVVFTFLALILISIPGLGQGMSGLGDPPPDNAQTKSDTGKAGETKANRFRSKQGGLSTLTGPVAPALNTVVDPNGAVISGATVTIKDNATGAIRMMTTDSNGRYSVVGLPEGVYTIEAGAPGFNKTVVQNVIIVPGQIAATGITLSPGGAAEAVIVTSIAPAIDTTTSHTATNYESQRLTDLPNLAPVDAFARLTPGIVTGAFDHSARLSAMTERDRAFDFLINGGRARSNYFTIDGRDNNDIDGRPAISINNPDAVETLHIVTTRGTGDVSPAGAAGINLITRPGTNNFHGTIFDYYLNSKFGALSPLERRSGLEQPPRFKDTIYGGTFGGPIRRDRMFIFGSFQAESETARRFSDSTSAFLTPTEAGLSSLARAFPNSPAVADLLMRGPLARQPGVLQTFRTFTLPVLGVPVEFGEIARILPSTSDGYEAGARFDWILTRRDTLRAVYWYDGRNSSNNVGRLAAGYFGDSSGRSQLGSLRWNRMISPRTSNEVGFGFNRARLSLEPAFTQSSTETAAELEPSLPSVIPGFRGLAYGQNPGLDTSHASNVFEASEHLIHIAGRHNVRLGGRLRRRLTSFDYLPGLGGNFTFATFDDFIAGRPSALAVAVGDPHSHFAETDQHYSIDDTWRARINLTLSFGLSYENTGQPINELIDQLREREANPNTALFDTRLPLDVRVPARVKSDNNNFAPRFGFAYTPRFRILDRDLFGYDETVIRGGVSVSYDRPAYLPLAEFARTAPNVLFGVLTPERGGLSDFPRVPGAAELSSLLSGDPRNFARAEIASDFRTPYSIVWHLSGSREIKEAVEFEMRYVGSRGLGLIRAVDGNPDITGTTTSGPLVRYESTGRSTYHSLQTRLDFQLRNDLVGGVTYTLSRLMDDVPEGSAQIAGGVGSASSLASVRLPSFAQNPFDISSGERAVSSLNRTHMATTHFLYTLPMMRGQSGTMGRLLGGWQASGILEFASGSPFTPLQFSGYGAGSSALFASIFSDRLGSIRPFEGNPLAPVDRVAFSNAANAYFHFFNGPDGNPLMSPTGFIIADRSGFRSGSPGEARFIYNDFAVEQAARALGLAPDAFGPTFAAGRPFGDVKRNSLTGPQLFNVDFALLKMTKLTEKVSLQFRAEFFNLFNHPNREKPNFVLENAGGFGFLDSGETDASPRRIRLALKLIF